MFDIRDFINDLKQYLKAKVISLDSSFSELQTFDAYTYEHTPTPPEIDIYIVDDNEDENSNSYTEGENISDIVLNIYCYTQAMVLGNDSTKTNAQQTSTYLAQLVKEALLKNNICQNNSNVISITKRSFTGAMNERDTKLYVSIYSYDIKVKNNYTKIYNNSI